MPANRYQGSPRERRALDAWIKINRAAEAIGHYLQAGLAAEGVSFAHMVVLEALHFVGPMSQADLGRKLLRGGANMTGLVDALEDKGLVERQRSTEDRRRIDVHLTHKGKALIEAVFPAHAARIADAFSSLTADEQNELGRLCKKLGLGLVDD
jgi:MarR family 2-MHQ and catechol resistance regulon transcriptional repressor